MDAAAEAALENDEVGLLSMRRLWKSRRGNMEPSAASVTSRTPPTSMEWPYSKTAATSRESVKAAGGGIPQASSKGSSPSDSSMVVAEEKVVDPSSLGGFRFSSAADVWLPGSTGSDSVPVNGFDGMGEPTSSVSQWSTYLQSLAQAQLWLACAGGIMIAFALNRARAVLSDWAQNSVQAKDTPMIKVKWHVDHNMVRSSALNSAG